MVLLRSVSWILPSFVSTLLSQTMLLICILPNRDQNSVVITCHLPPPSQPHFVLLDVHLVAFLQKDLFIVKSVQFELHKLATTPTPTLIVCDLKSVFLHFFRKIVSLWIQYCLNYTNWMCILLHFKVKGRRRSKCHRFGPCPIFGERVTTT